MEAALVQSLLRKEAYPQVPGSVHLLQTHVSLLFLTDSHVYKVKKPVDFGFLNFTTIDRRRFYCHEEVRLNRRLCPDMYLGVVEVRVASGKASFDGPGEIVDYAVKMKRLPQERMLDRLLEAGEVTGEEMRQVARRIASFHAGAEISPAEFGTPVAIRYNWEENFSQVEQFLGVTLRERDLQVLQAWVEEFLSQREGLLASRVAAGFIRECDGDIHLENICLADQIYIFDCIEFNDRFRYSDTAADLAFLLMDLDFHGRSDFSTVVRDEYVTATADAGCRELLPFYQAYRAVVRGKVESLRLADPMIPEGEKDAARARAARYFRLARGYALRDRLPLSLIITCGLTGSGKSSIAAALSLELGLETVSSDRIRKELFDVPLYRHDPDAYGSGLYTPSADEATYGALLQRAGQSLGAGRSVIVDATFRRREDRLAFRAVADRFGARFVIILTECPPETARQRLHTRATQTRVISDGRWEIYLQQQESFQAPDPHEGQLTFVDTSLSINDSIDTILHEMGLI